MNMEMLQQKQMHKITYKEKAMHKHKVKHKHNMNQIGLTQKQIEQINEEYIGPKIL